jgi:hypothetical protein
MPTVRLTALGKQRRRARDHAPRHPVQDDRRGLKLELWKLRQLFLIVSTRVLVQHLPNFPPVVFFPC